MDDLREKTFICSINIININIININIININIININIINIDIIYIYINVMYSVWDKSYFTNSELFAKYPRIGGANLQLTP